MKRSGAVTLISGNTNYHFSSHFQIDSKTGWITTKEVFDDDSKLEFRLEVAVHDGRSVVRTDTHSISLFVATSNQMPLFIAGSYLSFTVAENVAIGTTIGYVGNAPSSGAIFYEIIAGGFDMFGINISTGAIVNVLPLDYKFCSYFSILIHVVDHVQIFSHIIGVNVTVTFVNDNSPTFDVDPIILNVRENIDVGTIVSAVMATDSDSGSNGQLVYSLVSQTPTGTVWFSIDASNGSLETRASIDYEQVKQIIMVVKAAYGQQPSYFATVTVIVNVTDVNDNAPVFLVTTMQKYVFKDDLEYLPLLGMAAADLDSNGNMSYEIILGNVRRNFDIDAQTGK